MLRQLLDDVRSQSAEEINRTLFERELIVETKRAFMSVEEFETYELIKVRGKPVSDTLIEERR